MNIFVTDANPKIAARNLDDKRVSHMPKESIEMIGCYIHFVTGKWVIPFPLWGDKERLTEDSKLQLYNHPCSKWVRKDRANLWWLYAHLWELALEYKYRFDKELPTFHFIAELTPYIVDVNRPPSSFRNSSLFKTNMDIVTAYRETMMVKWFQTDKIKPVIWTKRGMPNWAIRQGKLF